jgi:hypothetical protein
VLEPERIAPWCDTVKLTFFAASGQLDPSVVPREQISCAFGFPRNAAGAIELGKHKTRGWDVLGGHVDKGEAPDVAAAREIKEEAGRDITIADLELFGYERLVETGPRRSLKHPYPVGGTLAGGTLAGGTLAGGTLAGGTLAGGTLAGGTLAGGTLAGGTLAGGTLAGGTLASRSFPPHLSASL